MGVCYLFLKQAWNLLGHSSFSEIRLARTPPVPIDWKPRATTALIDMEFGKVIIVEPAMSFFGYMFYCVKRIFELIYMAADFLQVRN